MKQALLGLVLGLLGVGCLPGGSTAAGSALVHPKFPYAVTYEDAPKKAVLGDDWKLETYRKEHPGTTPDSPVELVRKDGFESTYEFDFDDDDKTDAKQKLPIPDLVFVNKRTNARLEVVTLLLDSKYVDKELRLLLSDVVDSGSGTRSLFVGFGRSAAGLTKRYAMRLLDSQEATLGGQKGLVATIERADLDQLQLNPKARWRRTRLLLVHAPFDYQVKESSITDNGAAPKYHKYGVLMLVEYTNTPEDFEEQYPEFLKLVGKIHPLNDARMMGYLGSQLGSCSKDHVKDAKLSVAVDPLGGASVQSSDLQGLELVCTSSIVDAYPFAATGEARVVSATFDFSKPIEPAWLSQNEYTETRATAEADAKPDAVAPATPADGAPPAAPSDPAPATAAPTQAPGASSPSPSNSPESGSSSKP
jgi:hypothetical protein